MVEIPPIEFAPLRRGRVAYQVIGDGDQTIVGIPPSAQNIDTAWEWPAVRTMLERFGSFSRYVHYDKRGTGSSDRNVLVPGVDERVDELRAVFDAAGVERAHLFAQSEGGPTTLLFAATYPHRVESVILFGSAARMMPHDLSPEERAEQIERREAFSRAWGTPDSFVVDIFAPSLAGDPEYRAWHQRYERTAASYDSIRDLMMQMIDIDVRDVVPEIEAPILVLHRAAEQAMPIEMGREVAELARDATLVEVSGTDHFAYLGDIDEWMNEIERWVTGDVPDRAGPTAAPTGASVATLGRFAVTVDGEEIPTAAWGSRRARTLLKRLVAAQGWPVTRDELCELLWPDDPSPEKLGARLSVLLSGVRRILGGGIVADRQTIALDLDAVTCDLVQLLGAADDATVCALYEGEFLPEDRYEDWTAAPRDAARTHFVRAARARLDQLRQMGNSAGAVDLARRLVEADPYDDDAHRTLVAALERADDPVGAAAARTARAERLAELGLDVDPSET